MQKGPNGGQKRTHEGSIYAPVTLDARITTVNLVHGNGASGRGKYFSSTPPAVDAPRHPEPQCPPLAPCEKMRFSVNRDESSGNLKSSGRVVDRAEIAP